jgi:fumarylacetoacetate (FAA) hydrolase
MRLATRRTGARDGELVLVSADLRRALAVPHIARTLQDALDRWAQVEDALHAAHQRFVSGAEPGAAILPGDLLAPLPRTYAWIDCSAYPHPMELLARLRGAVPPDAATAARPPFFDGTSTFAASGEPLSAAGSTQLDYEAEVAFILGDVRRGADEKEAAGAIIAVTAVNDTTLRDVLQTDLEAGRSIYHAKPPCSMAPSIVTMDELGDAWDGGLLHARMFSWVNGRLLGSPSTGADTAVTVPELIAQAARTRPLGAGTVLGTGTVSNRDPSAGSACIAEARIRETLAHGTPNTAFLRPGDELVIDLRIDGKSVSGPIRHDIAPDPDPSNPAARPSADGRNAHSGTLTTPIKTLPVKQPTKEPR